MGVCLEKCSGAVGSKLISDQAFTFRKFSFHSTVQPEVEVSGEHCDKNGPKCVNCSDYPV